MAAVRKKDIWICSAWQDRKKGNCSHMCEQLRKKGYCRSGIPFYNHFT